MLARLATPDIDSRRNLVSASDPQINLKLFHKPVDSGSVCLRFVSASCSASRVAPGSWLLAPLSHVFVVVCFVVLLCVVVCVCVCVCV